MFNSEASVYMLITKAINLINKTKSKPSALTLGAFHLPFGRRGWVIEKKYTLNTPQMKKTLPSG